MGKNIALVAIVSFVSVCFISASIFENGDIEHRWLPIKAWASFEFPSFPVNHHNLRWGISLPATAFVMLFGASPLAYLIFNYLIFAAATAGLFGLVQSISSPKMGAAILAVWAFNPIVYFLAPNLMPEVFSVFYVVVAAAALMSAYVSHSRLMYAAGIVVLFFAYGAKETNIFFLPGLVLYELWQRRYVNCLLIGAVWGAGLVIETGIIDFILRESGIIWGRPEAVLRGGHGEDLAKNFSHFAPADMFLRWWFISKTNLDRLEYYSKIVYLSFFLTGIWVLIARAARSLRSRGLRIPDPLEMSGRPGEQAFVEAMLAIGISFAVCTTFFIISWKPFLMGQPPEPRYLWVLLVPALLVLSRAFHAQAQSLPQQWGWMFGGSSGFSVLRRAKKNAEKHNVSGRAVLVGILVSATLARAPIEWGLVKYRRSGFLLPYSLLTVNEYYTSIRSRLVDGCTLVFATRRAAWSALIYAFPYGYFEDPVAFYRRRLDGLRIAGGGSVQGWEPRPQDWQGLPQKLHVVSYPSAVGPVWELYAIRFEMQTRQTCERAYYLGHVDIHPHDQELGPQNR